MLPCSCTVTTTRSIGTPSLCAVMRHDAQVRLVRHQPVDVAVAEPGAAPAPRRRSAASLTTACLKTSCPAIFTTPAVPVDDGPPST